MEERRGITRIEYTVPGVIVVIDNQEVIQVKVNDISPLGMGVLVDKGLERLLNKEIIIVADCMVMNAIVTRLADFSDEQDLLGIRGKSFDQETLQYLFEHIG